MKGSELATKERVRGVPRPPPAPREPARRSGRGIDSAGRPDPGMSDPSWAHPDESLLGRLDQTARPAVAVGLPSAQDWLWSARPGSRWARGARHDLSGPCRDSPACPAARPRRASASAVGSVQRPGTGHGRVRSLARRRAGTCTPPLSRRRSQPGATLASHRVVSPLLWPRWRVRRRPSCRPAVLPSPPLARRARGPAADPPGALAPPVPAAWGPALPLPLPRWQVRRPTGRWLCPRAVGRSCVHRRTLPSLMSLGRQAARHAVPGGQATGLRRRLSAGLRL